ncbi:MULTISPECIES: isopentenyl-diphosphate Delta-isomerase [unclassified Gordonia (in: high G+C Gram-positive bacteria)]|uniref:isopentenyl-diphosphate Delta-isomerase n=2 Tax=Gordonia TaxID=2053 RepID=UPI001F0EC52A|nr:isopentenyl-diphosphate Delta-isomerase [Gordonia sp. ABSL49_1]MCH5642605.1 isopentenyl-diphosphate Delta-isomerase [Gordonia sp. ABSL49_1]
MTDDLVVLVDAHRQPCGTAPRTSVHGTETPLHLAFSCHLVDSAERILMTRRALSKPTWPGVWTNSFCGHPRPGEHVEDAIRRYAPRELGLDIDDLTCILPDFEYRAVDAGGVVENEICPVYWARPVGTPVPNPDEVMDLVWAPIEDVWAAANRTPWVFSPWFVEQVHALGSRPLDTVRWAS